MPAKGVQVVDVTVAVLVFTAVLGLSAWVGLRTRTGVGLEDYLLARSSQGPMTLGVSFFASGLGAWILFAPPEVGAGLGVVGVAGYAVAAGAPFVAFAVVGARLRLLLPAGHGLTEFVALRFGRGVHAFVVGVSILYMLVFVTAELTAISAVTAILSRLDPRLAVVAVVAVTATYTARAACRPACGPTAGRGGWCWDSWRWPRSPSPPCNLRRRTFRPH